jgi:hypothetical protein
MSSRNAAQRPFTGRQLTAAAAFAAVLLASSATLAACSSGSSGTVSGYARIKVTEVSGHGKRPKNPDRELPVEGRAEILSRHRVIQTVRIAHDGRFQAVVTPGRYSLRIIPQKYYYQCRSVTPDIRVRANADVQARITCVLDITG